MIRKGSLAGVLCLVPAILLHGSVLANVRGIGSVRVIPAEEPPEYDLDQIENEATDTIRRVKRNLRLRVALLQIDPLGPHTENDCGRPHPLAAPFQLLCRLGNTVERAARQAAINETSRQIQEAHVDSDPDLAPEFASSVDQLLSSNLLQLRLAEAVGEFVAGSTGIEIVDGSSTGYAGYSLAPSLVRIEAFGNNLDGRIAIRLHGEAELTRNRDGAAVDRYGYTAVTPGYLLDSWTEGGTGLLAHSVSDGIRKMAEVLSEQLLLTVTSPHQKKKGYLVVATSPKYKTTLMGKATFRNARGQYRPTRTLQPTLAWEDFRDAYARDPLYPDVSSPELEVRYDLRIYRSRPGGHAPSALAPDADSMGIPLMPADLVLEQRGISGETFTPDAPFRHCTPYAWTVRARFVAHGRTHLTHWSGMHWESKIEKMRRWRVADTARFRMARSLTGAMGVSADDLWSEEFYYFPFLATAPGKKCSREEVLAAMAEADAEE